MKTRYVGGVLGVAVGDALGATLEFMSAKAVKARYGELREIIGGGWLAVRPGETTDDTAMTVAVARGILESPKRPLEPIGQQFLRWYKTYPPDVGNIIRSALEAYRQLEDWEEASRHAHKVNGKSAGNGSLMRCLPVALAYWRNPWWMKEISWEQSKLTHWDEEAAEACILYNEIIRLLLKGWSLQDALAKSVAVSPGGSYYTSAIGPHLTVEGLHPSGYVVDTLRCVLWAVNRSASFEEAVIKAVNLGGDADTIGAIAGGLAGVAYGVDNIPQRWLDVLEKREELEELAAQLWRLSEECHAYPVR